MSQAPKTDLARELWETCPECYGNLLADRDGALYCARGHYRAANATSLPPDVDAGQIVNEFEEVLAVEKERAKENMSKGGRGERVGNVSNPSDNETSAAREKAAEKVNADISGRTLEKGRGKESQGPDSSQNLLESEGDAGQIVNEFEEMLEIEEKKAEDRMEEAGSVGGKGIENFQYPSKGLAKDKAAEKVNADISGRTLEKGRGKESQGPDSSQNLLESEGDAGQMLIADGGGRE
jgi:hypothetical protein